MIKSEDCVVSVNPDNKVVRVTGRKSPVAICASRNQLVQPYRRSLRPVEVGDQRQAG